MMTPAEYITAAVDSLPKRGVYWRHIRARLMRLARDPGKFWPAYLAISDAQQHEDPVRQFAQDAVRSGAAGETSLPELVKKHLAIPK